MNTKRTLVISELRRLRNSTMGNPTWVVGFSDGSSARTQTNAQVGYILPNPEFNGVPVVVEFNKAGRIVGIEVAKV